MERFLFAHAMMKNMQNKSNKGYMSHCMFLVTVELKWLEHHWNLENMFETGVVRANEY